jgi:hypothetical protein
VAAAFTEVTSQSPQEIEAATAVKWGARALAAWAIAQAQPAGSPAFLQWYKEAAAYRHEAQEHAGWATEGLLEAIKLQLQGVP